MKHLIVLIFFLSISMFTHAQTNNKLNLDKNNVAVKGYDLVSYFEGNPTQGMEYLSVNYKESIYFFTTAHNQNLFKKSPEQYLPQYGGWCAYGMSKGAKFDPDPLSYKIVDDKLFLFFKNKKVSTLEKWNADEKACLLKAESNWDK